MCVMFPSYIILLCIQVSRHNNTPLKEHDWILTFHLLEKKLCFEKKGFWRKELSDILEWNILFKFCVSRQVYEKLSSILLTLLNRSKTPICDVYITCVSDLKNLKSFRENCYFTYLKQQTNCRYFRSSTLNWSWT